MDGANWGRITGRTWGERLRKTLGLGAENPTDTIRGPVLPVLEMETDYLARPDLAWPSGEILCVADQFIAASAADHSRLVLNNPAASGYLLVLEWVALVSSAVYVGIFHPGAGLAGYTDVNFHYVRDGRVRSLSAPGGNLAGPGRVLVRNDNALGAGDDIVFKWNSLVTNSLAPVRIGWVIPPGQSLGFVSTAAGTQLQVSIAWRARPMSSGAEGV